MDEEKVKALVTLFNGDVGKVDRLLAEGQLGAYGDDRQRIKSMRQMLVRYKEARRPATLDDILNGVSRSLTKGFDPRCQ